MSLADNSVSLIKRANKVDGSILGAADLLYIHVDEADDASDHAVRLDVLQGAQARLGKTYLVTDPRFGNASESASAATNLSAIRTALSAASDAGGGLVLLPGIFAVPAVASIADGIRIYSNVTLAGFGYGSGVSIDPASYTADASYNVFSYESNSAAYNFRVNGLKGSVNRSGLAAVFNNVFYAANSSVSDVLFDSLWLHDVLGIGGESFGIQMQGTQRVTRPRLRGCKAWNFEGTPFSLAGYIETTGAWNSGSLTALDAEVEDCESFDNTYHGITLFGAKNVALRGMKAYRNAACGINIEWSEDVDLYGCVGAYNTIAGLNTFGNVLNLRDHGGAYYENNTANSSSQGEIMVRKGAWWGGSPIPRGTAVSIELHGTTARPNGSNPHLYVERDTAVNTTYVDPVSGSTLTAGSQVRSLKLNVPDAHLWTITNNGSGLAVNGGVSFPASPALVSPHAGGIAGWTATANMTIATSGFSGNRSGGAVRLTGTAQFVNVTTPLVLKPNSTYLVVYRVKPADATEWRLAHQESGGTRPQQVLIPITTPDLGQWHEGTAVFVTGANPTKLTLILNGSPSGSSILDVDYCYAVEVVGSGAASAVQSHSNAISADRGNASVTLTVGLDAPTQLFATTLTANRVVTLATTGVYNGARFKIVRTGLGAFTLDVGGLKTIPSATAAAVEVMHTGTAWVLTGYELL